MKTSVNLTFQDYLEYDDNTNCLYELVDGELKLMTPASPFHSDIIDFIFKQFDREIERCNLDYVVKQTSVGIRTNYNTSRLPDVCVIPKQDWQELRKMKVSSAVLEVPFAVIIEVVSPGKEGQKRDYIDKKNEYQDKKIPEYWIVDPQGNKISILSLVNSEYEVNGFTDNQIIVSKTFPNLELTVEQILLS